MALSPRVARAIAACALLATGGLLAACDDTVVVQLQTGPQRFEVSASALALPAALEDASSGTIASVPCGPMGMCPSSASVAITCEAGVCDPAPRTLSGPVGDVVDVDVLASEARSLLRRVDTIEVVEASYQVGANSLTVDLPETEVFWGPEGAADVDPAMGVVRLGVVPPLPAGSVDPGTVALDPVGVAALSDYLVGTSRRVRFFARTRVDLAPGDPFPAGSAAVLMDLRVRITGSLVR